MFVADSDIEPGVKNNAPTTQLKVKTLLNRLQPFAGFIYQRITLTADTIEVEVQSHAQRRPRCSRCQQSCPGYDRLPPRRWLFVPLWNLPVWFIYAPRRVCCPLHGIVVEHMPWSVGNRPIAAAMMDFLARWARRLSWLETARVFHTSWEAVYRSVAWLVDYGLAHRDLSNITAIGIDDIHWGKGKHDAHYLTLIYQIDHGCRRLLWVGRRRTQAILRRGLAELGLPVVGGLKFVCTDMWKPYLEVIRKDVAHALHVLDRFHITALLNQAVDQVRRAESTRLRSQARAAPLKKMRWQLLRRGTRVRGQVRQRLHAIVRSKLATGRAWVLKESFVRLWTYHAPVYASAFLSAWCRHAQHSRLVPLQRVALTLRTHHPLILNWFRAKGEISSAAVEGLNNKVRVVTRRSYGFKAYDALQLALYHNLAHLPEPPLAHKFC